MNSIAKLPRGGIRDTCASGKECAPRDKMGFAGAGGKHATAVRLNKLTVLNALWGVVVKVVGVL